jgi:predicted nucleic acid-binding protein
MPAPIPHIDTDVIIRLLTNDDPAKQQAAKALFEQVEQGTVTTAAPDTVIADAVFVLHSPRHYNRSRSEIRALLTPLVRLPHFRVRNRRVVLRALALYGSSNSGFGDATLRAAMEITGATILYSYDRGFDKYPIISRHEP